MKWEIFERIRKATDKHAEALLITRENAFKDTETQAVVSLYVFNALQLYL